MTDTHLDSLCDPIQCFLDKPAKEDQTIENSPITLLQILLLQIHGQFLQEMIFLLEVKLLPNINALLDIVIDLLLELVGQLVFIRQLLKCLIIFALLNILRTDITNQRTDSVDVIGQTHHAKDLYHDQAQRLL
jgi:hypothetical protein